MLLWYAYHCYVHADTGEFDNLAARPYAQITANLQYQIKGKPIMYK